MSSVASNETVSRRESRAWPLAIIALLAVLALWVAGTYNGLISSDQRVESQWAQVQNVYQRRLDLVPNLVQTVKGAATFEKETFTAVAEARSRAQGALSSGRTARVDQTQGELSSALRRLMVVVERYPELRATQNFLDLQSQLEGTENRIAVERMRFNEAARDFNSRRASFPTSVVAGLFGSRFAPKTYFRADAAAQTAPKVEF